MIRDLPKRAHHPPMLPGFITFFIITGIAVVLISRAAGTPIAFEPETGTFAAGATATSISGQSGSGAIKFGTPNPTPTPGTTSCPLPAYPNETCTGVPAGTTLTNYTGPSGISTAGTVIDSKILGCIGVNAPGVIIRKSKINCPGGYGIDSYGYTGTPLLIEDSEIDCQFSHATGIGEINLTARRLNIHGCENGFDVDGDMLIEDSYIHDLYNLDAAHSDGVQLTNFAKNVTIRHNTIYTNDTSAIISPPIERGLVENILITQNLMAGGGYTLYCEQNGPGVNYRVIDNHFSRIFYPNVGITAPWTDCADETLSGNVYHETGQALTPN